MYIIPMLLFIAINKVVLGKDRNVVTEMKNGANHISQDGKKVAEGNKIFIPWTNEGENEKIYAWSDNGAKKTNTK